MAPLVKVRRAVAAKAVTEQVPPRAMRFLEDHAEWTEKVLNLQEVQEFLSIMFEKEGMDETPPPEVVIMLLPHPDDDSASSIAHGSYLPLANEIRIYPGLAAHRGLNGVGDDDVRPFRETISEGNAGITLAHRHILTLIHELLHSRYGHDEVLVESKSEEYMAEFFSWMAKH